MSNARTTEIEDLVMEYVRNTAQHVVERTDRLVEGDAVGIDPASIQAVDSLLAQLGSEAFEVMEKYFGLSGDEPLSAREIGHSMDLSEDHIMEVISQALQRLRDLDSANDLGRKVA